MRVLISGGAGYLGRAFLRRAYERWDDTRLDWDVTIFSRDEQKQNQARRRYPQARYVLGDVCDTDRLAAAMTGHDVVIHAAAVKYIPEAEENPGECVRVNVDGARSVITAAVGAGVNTVVGISTDKAVRPLNCYGLSKAIQERLFTEAQHRSGPHGTRFQTVRYGNVVGSTGSVIPLFQWQLHHDGFVTLTDPHMTRFWMPVDEAVDTVLYALNAQWPGSVTVPRPRAMRMGDLATTLAGETPEAVKVIGIRPGEKEHEELMHATESAWMYTAPDLRYYELVSRAFAPPDAAADRNLTPPHTLASHTPAGGWVQPDELRAWVLDASNV